MPTILIYIEKLLKDVKTNYEHLRARQLVRQASWRRARQNINISPLHSQRAHPQKSHRLVIITSLKLLTVTVLFNHHSSHSLHMYVIFFFASAIFMSLQIFTSPLYSFFSFTSLMPWTYTVSPVPTLTPIWLQRVECSLAESNMLHMRHICTFLFLCFS